MALCIITLVLWPLRHVWLGVELTDSAYSAGNYALLDRLDQMWLFSTYLANLCGAWMSSLPFGQTMMGLNTYTALTVSLLSVLCFCMLVRRMKVSYGIAWLGLFLAESLCWCPTTILYNYLTYLLFNAAVILLFVALRYEQRYLFVMAGILLGCNFMVRFPNIVECLLIVAVWYYGYLVKKRFKDVVLESILSIGGFLLGAGIWLLQMIVRYGMDAYVTAITRLLSMPSEATDYSLTSMILTPLLDYKASARWLLCMIALVLVMTILFWIGKERGYRFKQALMLIGIAGLFAWWYRLGVFNLRYYTYESMFQWVAVLLLITILFALSLLIRKEADRGQKLYAMLVLIVLFVTPLGSNNHLYPNINNLFLVAPFTLQQVWELIIGRQTDDGYLPGELYYPVAEWKEHLFPSFPLKSMLIAFLCATIVQGVCFGAVFTFRDGMSGQIRDTKIEKNAILSGMVTNRELAEQIESLTMYIEDAGLSDRSVILYGQIPALSYYLEMPPAISTTWPDLRSYSLEMFQREIAQVEKACSQNAADRPLIIVSASIDAYLTEDAEGLELTGTSQAQIDAYAADEKLSCLTAFMEAEGYTESYCNSGFAIFE